MIGSAVLRWCVDFIPDRFLMDVMCLYNEEYFQMN